MRKIQMVDLQTQYQHIKADIDRKHAASRFKFQTLPVYQNGLPIVLEEPTDYYNPNKK